MLDYMTLCAEVAEQKVSGDWSVIWSTVLTGIIVVFCILLILVGFLYLMGFILSDRKKKTQTQPASVQSSPAQSAPVQQAEAEEYDEYEDNDEEIIAVISAAIAAYCEADGKQYKIVGVKKREKALRSNWSSAGISDNTRPF